MSSPSMVHRSGDSLVVRSVVSGNALFEDVKEAATARKKEEEIREGEEVEDEEEEEEEDLLPQCKIKRNYSCPHCSYYTQNPRSYLYHLRDDHGEKIKVYECPSCLYASKHSQKLQRHVHMVHVIGRRGGSGADSGGRKKTAANMAASWTNNVEATSKSSMLQKKKQPKGGGEDVAVAGERNEDASGNGEGVRECSVCAFTSSNPAEVARHERTAHLKKKFYRCSKCNYVTHMKARYTKHVKYHSMPMIKCDLCDFRTPYKWNLDRHYKNHTGDGAYRCALCNFTADIKQSLTVHEMNHHVPPVGQGAIVAAAAGGGGGGGARRRNKVGASDSLQQEEIDQEELELLRMEREDAAEASEPEEGKNTKMPGLGTPFLGGKVNNSRKVISNGSTDTVIPSAVRQASKVKVGLKKVKNVSTQEQNERHNFQTDFIHPDDIIHHKNGNVYIKTLRCRMCNYKAAWEGEMARHESKAHGIGRPKPIVSQSKKIPRPIPNLIPIQNKAVNSSNANLPILRIPSVRSRAPNSVLKPSTPPENSLSEQDLNEICAKSCPNSSLKDFASVIGGEEVFRTTDEDLSELANADTTGKTSPVKEEETVASEETSVKPASPPPTEIFKKKNASFFDKLKEKLLVGAGESCNLVCTYCGHESKCLSELARHQKLHLGGTSRSLTLSSTRCQYCRQRCKTSADLMVHLQSCSEANKSVASADAPEEEEEEDGEQENKDDVQQSNKLKIALEEPEAEEEEEEEEEEGGELKPNLEEEPHPMENKVFVWNNLPEEHGSPDEGDHSSEGSLVGVETAPGYGAVTNKMPCDTVEVPPPEVDPKVALTVKKVFKCPHCSFWASTASRFHVHIVGHLNKKPFECSLCAYRSNWRWDITKHIRLKSARDISHERARVLMTDETGRRNYSKYNKYLTLMRVHEPSAESSGSGRRTKTLEGSMTPQPVKVMQLPAPPRLTRAPTPVPSTTPPVGPLRPPPPLRAAHQVVFPGPPPLHPQPHVAKKRPATDEPENLPQPKKPNSDSKKTLWKCKKCNYRDASRELVLAHVKEHYQQRQQQQQQQQQLQQQLHQQDSQEEQQQQLPQSHKLDGDDEASVNWGQAPFRCGHCLQRHCRLKHSGDVRVVIGLKDGGTMEENFTVDDSEHMQGDEQTEQNTAIVCDKCPYSTNSAVEMSSHREQHHSRPGAIFKCYFCPFYVSHKRDLLQHMRLHGVNEPEDYISKALNATKSPVKADKPEEGGRQHHNIETSPHKRYKCFGCPYVSNSKSQFLYHKQFHRPRTSQFKCSLCSYNVSRRHLLHQHLRVHGILVPPQKSPSKSGMGTDNDGDGTDIEEITELPSLTPSYSQNTIPALDTRQLRDIPLVWVSRSGNFCKMFKCRYCPHVNARKANIQEHEKMHRARDTDNSSGDGGHKEGTQQQQFHCPDCNYICNNAGVLSSHAKVHQGLYGQVHCLVDTTRSDEVQLRELNASINREENDDGMEIRDAEEETMDFQLESPAESSPPRGTAEESEAKNVNMEERKVLHFCKHCPARFLFEKELNIHTRFHEIRLAYRCESCSYTARQRPHLLAHLRVHTDEYQQRTNSLVDAYSVSSVHPRPKTAVVIDGPGVIGSVWVVISKNADADKSSVSTEVTSTSTGRPVVKQYSCHLCPAKFFKSMALQYHVTLHGGSGPHKCRQCDYAVKTYGNLVKHEMIHKSSSPLEKKPKSSTGPNLNTIPISGTELFQHRTEAQKQSIAEKKTPSEPLPLHVDPQFGILMHGNPDFIYPTYFKNGRLKEKRYKCHKCPSAFEKREQYKVHLSLHGSRQRYRCEKCDYSVKYYANYIQHMRKHKNNEEAQEARKLERGDKDETQETKEDDEGADDSSIIDDVPVAPSTRTVKTIGSTHQGPLQLSTADQQTLILMQKRQENANSSGLQDGTNSEERRSFRCPHCPYTSPRRDGVESHIKRHLVVSGVRGAFVCAHCDYTVPQLHFLREHNKLHFNRSKKLQPDIYMKFERLELWVTDEGKENITTNVSLESNGGKRLLFKDSGTEVECDERFIPPLSPVEEIPEEEKIYVDPRTGEKINSIKPEPSHFDLRGNSKQLPERENADDKVCVAENILAAEDTKSETESTSSSSTSSSSGSSSSSSSSSTSNSSGTNSSSNSSSSSGSTTTTSTSGESDSESEGAPAVVDDASSTCSMN